MITDSSRLVKFYSHTIFTLKKHLSNNRCSGSAERRNSTRLKTNHYGAPHANTAAIPPAGEQCCEPTRASGGRRLARVALVIWRVKTTSRRRSDSRKQKPWREVLLLWVAECDCLIENLANVSTVFYPEACRLPNMVFIGYHGPFPERKCGLRHIGLIFLRLSRYCYNCTPKVFLGNSYL